MASIKNDDKIVEINIGGLEKQIHQVTNDKFSSTIQELGAKLLMNISPQKKTVLQLLFDLATPVLIFKQESLCIAQSYNNKKKFKIVLTLKSTHLRLTHE